MMKRMISLVLVLGLVFFLTSSAYATLDIIWVSDAFTPAGDFAAGENVDPALQGDDTPWDQPWVDLLTAQGYNVDYTKGTSPGDGYWRSLDDDKIAALNAADRVIVSRDTRSGDYGEDDEPSQWNSVTTPMILMNPYFARSSRWKWFDTTGMAENGNAPLIDGAPPFDVVFTDLDVLDETVGTGNTSFVTAKDAGNGLAIALVDDALPAAAEGGIDDLAGSISLALWAEGVEFYNGAGQTAGGPRLYFAGGTREGDVEGGYFWGAGMYNLTADGEAIFLAAVATIPEPATIALLGLGGLALLSIRRRR